MMSYPCDHCGQDRCICDGVITEQKDSSATTTKDVLAETWEAECNRRGMRIIAAEAHVTELEGQLASERKIKESEKKILIQEIESHTATKAELASLRAASQNGQGWQLIITAPKDGRHIQAADFSGQGCGFGGNPQQSYQCVVHWWQWSDGTHQEEWGWYPSTGAGENPALTNLTHWKPLEEMAAPPSEANGPQEGK